MTQKEKIYQALLTDCDSMSSEKFKQKHGFSTVDIANQLGISRANTSHELNKLIEKKMVTKIKEYPVKYIATNFLKQKLGLMTNKNIFDSYDELIQKCANATSNHVFSKLIGYNGSLAKAISIAKASIAYPPHGLNILITGPTGSGKTYFANIMYEYAKENRLISNDAPFVVFNCADFYDNPQLLMDHLFGHIKGAYTGALNDDEGIVEHANNGILFLDEVHRLPPEGQEMLFYLLDHGKFNRLGEKEKKRSANLLVICATTENPSSSLLNTFIRRIPTLIKIPSLSSRPIVEKIELCNFLFQQEAQRIRKNLYVDIGVYVRLLSVPNYANIGQLKTQIQLTCAKSFVTSLDNENEKFISISEADVPDSDLNKNQQLLSEQDFDTISNLLNLRNLIKPNQSIPNINKEENIYDILRRKKSTLEHQNIPTERINQYLLTDIRFHIKSLLKLNPKTSIADEFISKETIELCKELQFLAEKALKKKFDYRFIFYLGLHLDSFLAHNNKNDLSMISEIENAKKKYPKEYDVALKFKDIIEKKQNIILPNIEVVYLTELLNSIDSLYSNNKIGIVVSCHGDSIASGIVEVVKNLLGKVNIMAVDMPLSKSITTIFPKLCEAVKKVNQNKGVIILSDMGSLTHLDKKIHDKTGIAVQSMDFVSTPIALEVTRKANFSKYTVNELVTDTKKSIVDNFRDLSSKNSNSHTKAILSICMSGEGTAQKLANVIHQIIEDTTENREEIEVINLSVLNFKKIAALKRNYNIIAAVGTKSPNDSSIPFISMENLLSGNGEGRLRALILNKPVTKKGLAKSKTPSIISNICHSILDKQLIVLNPYKIINYMESWLHDLTYYNKKFSNSLIIKVFIHTAFAAERALQNEQLKVKNDKLENTNFSSFLFTGLKSNVEIPLKIKFNSTEKRYILAIFKDEI
ncbi:sigma 54-interacting transcriptional regulator [Lactobacillus sp. ESL0791]|uniref:sigma-54-dependent transcriptional regulator n=1 Tax=Lactobacillus sp. ESL0791 TaxID=2983234 RepID=UPI0023F6B797|nr:sigma 54-interacting transcriptional regulator [Lactobacillus sp. ESL0791]MDF7639467.1 sigma 54-interacting transcriptional regulator [Lactobacillus sp. ESL0791]